jgi:hypothetical protein
MACSPPFTQTEPKLWRDRRASAVLVAAALLLSIAVCARQTAPAPASFAAQIAALSEPGGYFNTDNLISNEQSYLNVIPALRRAGLRGGVYVGVGPDQNFSYIAQLRPSLAFIVDIRRDNLLLHLLFKALFQLSPTRVEYLSLLCGRPAPDRLDEWKTAPLERMVAYIDGAAGTPGDAGRRPIEQAIGRFGVPLSAEELRTIDRFHRRFIDAGLDLKFQTTGRTPQSYYPTYRDLLLATDEQGHRWNYLASDDDYRFVRALEARDAVIPIVGDLAGSAALAGIGRVVRDRGERLTAFYASNVEFYLYGEGRFPRFVENLSKVPRAGNSLLIRSVFGGYAGPRAASASLVQPVDELVDGVAAGRFRSYWELVRPR